MGEREKWPPPHEHAPATTGPRYPLVYGSAKTEMCSCGVWRVNHHGPGRWRNDDINEATKPRDPFE